MRRALAGLAGLAGLAASTALHLAAAAPHPDAAPAPGLRAQLDATIRPLMARQHIPGMAVAVAVDGRAYVFNYGTASPQGKTPVTDRTLFEIGSVTKMFTATLAAYAQETGQLSLADHPSRHLPQLKGRPIDAATLLHLGTYTAGGLPLQFPDAVGDADDDALAYLHDWQASAAPGTVREYSNPSLGLLGTATAAAMHAPYATLMEGTLLPKLGLAHTWIRVPAGAQADYAWGSRDGKTVHMSPGPMAEPTYGVRTTAADLLRFLQLNIDPSGLEPPLRRAVEITHAGRFGVGGMVQGLGWEQYPYPVSRELLLGGNASEVINDPIPVRALDAPPAGPRLFDKTGSTGGFGAYVLFVPSKRVAVVMLANRNYPIPERVEAGYAILQALSPEDR